MTINRQKLAINGVLIVGTVALTELVTLRAKPAEVALLTQGPMTQIVVTSGRIATLARTDIATRAHAQGNQGQGTDPALAQARLAQAVAARLDQFILRAPGPANVIARAADPSGTAQAGRVLLTLAVSNELHTNPSLD